MNPLFAPLLAQEIPMPDSSVNHKGSYWFPEEASSFAGEIDFLFMAIFWISTLFFAIIVGVMVYFVIKYRRREGVGPQPSPSHNTTIEILWSVLPSIILVWIFYVGAKGFFEMRVSRDDAEEIYVTASQFNWKFIYPDGDISNELHIVLDRPTKLIMRSDDVLHSMYIPAFRQKMDIVPGRYTYAYLDPTKSGQFRLACTEYCGEGHSRMRTICEVHMDSESRKKVTEWKNDQNHLWVNGERLYQINCSGCHSIDGVAKTGPAFNLIWGEDRRLMDGSTVTGDEQYIRESILVPSAKVVEGYGPVTKMNSFEGKLSEDEIIYLIEYIKYLKNPAEFPAREDPLPGASDTSPADDSETPVDETSGDSGSDDETTSDADNNQ